MPDSPKDPTANYRKYPKGPNFGLIVILASIAIIVLLALGVLYFKTAAGKKGIPVHPNPTPNASLQLSPGSLRLG